MIRAMNILSASYKESVNLFSGVFLFVDPWPAGVVSKLLVRSSSHEGEEKCGVKARYLVARGGVNLLYYWLKFFSVHTVCRYVFGEVYFYSLSQSPVYGSSVSKIYFDIYCVSRILKNLNYL